MSWLDGIRVASPCQESWEDMSGDERVRHCARCEHEVYDLSGLSRVEAEALVGEAARGASICARFRRRADGRVITADCPSRLARGRRSGWRRAAAALLAGLGASVFQGCEPEPEPMVMGKMVCPPNLQQPSPSPSSVAPLGTRVGQGKRLPEAGRRA